MAERVEQIRAGLDKPCQSQYLREDVRFLLAEYDSLVASLQEVERERDEARDGWAKCQVRVREVLARLRVAEEVALGDRG